MLTPPVLINDDDRERGPYVDVSANEANYWKKRLKHGFVKDIYLYAKFESAQKAHTFHVEYCIYTGNHPEIREGKITLIIKN